MNFLKKKFFSFWYIYSMRSGAVMIQPAATMVKIFPRKNVIFWWPTIASGSWCTNGHLQILSFSFRPKILSIGFKSKKFYIKIKPLDEVCCRVASLVQCIPNYIFTYLHVLYTVTEYMMTLPTNKMWVGLVVCNPFPPRGSLLTGRIVWC